MSRRGAPPEVNAGSMADIAFLLLIFFLVTTTIETDAGLDRMLPPMETDGTIIDIRQKNIFTVNINKENLLLVEEQLTDLKDLRALTIAFLDNGGALSGTPEYCSYCKGERNPKSSDNPTKAIVSLKNDRETKYGVYITVQNELVGAYNDLRNRESLRLFKMKYTDMESQYLNSETSMAIKASLKEKLGQIKAMYPLLLSEVETVFN
ncbi:MAG: biopolymer transporter ExbD [Cellulophaga sp.]